eukprot:CAMPEP_0202448002 /NCGR_PEP_ID=MMETSP1360-20130828/6785_1 /ASSEMBLY_ACC=CAM_ASM_000848 /TAXON_ID=515479 /ORGANISM="Licmophora paradoxa, Strain CCMP2313" /LENGTH=391 /DNA_ID=CAMNT_0049065357 /DNA_START=128 /DNA_END=1303 /DNA_ORIENTATION=-
MSSSQTVLNQNPPAPLSHSHDEAAAAAVASLQSIASAFTSRAHGQGDGYSDGNGSVGGSADTIAAVTTSTSGSEEPCKKKLKIVDEAKREERNAREKERSFRISRQINELRNLLSKGGIVVPKGTKSSVLTEAANYIRMLQHHQYRSEIDRHQLVQQMQQIGGGSLGKEAASAVRHVAAQNGVWSLGNFGGAPPKSAMTTHTEQGVQEKKADTTPPLSTTIESPEYRFVFNSCSVGMAIASMGGAFIDCNRLFCQLSSYTKQEVCSMTLFNLTSREDLQTAFDIISDMISPPTWDPQTNGSIPPPKRCVLKGSMKERTDLGLSIALIKSEDGLAKCFCVTLIQNPCSHSDHTKLVPATAEQLTIPQPAVAPQQLPKRQISNMNITHAYTSG